MIVNKNSLKKVMLTATTVFGLMQCSEEEVLMTPAASPSASETPAATASDLTISSMTISGVNTVFATAKDCKTCTYVVPEGTDLVDGKALGFEPGNVICLNAAFKYGSDIEFINMEGSEEKPIVITTVGATEHTSASEQTFDGDPY